MRLLPQQYELPFSITAIGVMLVMAVCCIAATLKHEKTLIKYIAELTQVANDITIGKLDDEILYESEDEIGLLAHDCRCCRTD